MKIQFINMDIQPSNAGFIECNGIRNTNQNTITIPINKTSYCNAIPERGYTFNSWSGLSFSEVNPIKLTFNEYGNMIANFRPTLSYEQYIFIIGGIIGIFSLSLVGFTKEDKEENLINLSRLLIKLLKMQTLAIRMKRPTN